MWTVDQVMRLKAAERKRQRAAKQTAATPAAKKQPAPKKRQSRATKPYAFVRLTEAERNNLRNRRLALGLTQEQLATIAGISQGSVSDYEIGRASPRPATLAKWIAALSDEELSQST